MKVKKQFGPTYKTYDDSQGRGNPREWSEAFYERMGYDKAVEVLGSDDPLVIFGLGANASWDEVKVAYRKMAMKHHPDRGGRKEDMQKINAAFEVLEKRYGKGK